MVTSSREYYRKRIEQLRRPAPRKLCPRCGGVMDLRERDGWQYYECPGCGRTEEG